MEWTTENYNALKDAVQQGVKRVKYTDKEVEYRDLNDMIKLLRDAERSLGLINDAKNRTYATTSKGL